MSKAENFINEVARWKETAYNRGVMAQRPRYNPAGPYGGGANAADHLSTALQELQFAANIMKQQGNAQDARFVETLAGRLIMVLQRY